MDISSEKIFEMYKSREDVELCFNTLKTHLEMDKTYLRENEKIRGYFIVGLFAARIYFHILKKLREKELVSKVSVDEIFLELSKLHKIVENNGQEYFAKVPKRASAYVDLFRDKLMG